METLTYGLETRGRLQQAFWDTTSNVVMQVRERERERERERMYSSKEIYSLEGLAMVYYCICMCIIVYLRVGNGGGVW